MFNLIMIVCLRELYFTFFQQYLGCLEVDHFLFLLSSRVPGCRRFITTSNPMHMSFRKYLKNSPFGENEKGVFLPLEMSPEPTASQLSKWNILFHYFIYRLGI